MCFDCPRQMAETETHYIWLPYSRNKGYNFISKNNAVELVGINQLLEIRNKLVDEAEKIELYDVMGAFDSENAAIEGLTKEIGQLKNK